LASALYKLVYGSARVSKTQLKQMEGYKAFFANDPSRAYYELRELKQVDTDLSGTIDQNELLALRSKTVKIGTKDKLMEALSTHPNMVKRIKHLSHLS
jgi:heat shock protein HtpX